MTRRQRPLRAPPAGEWLGSPNYTAGRPARPDRFLLHHMAGSLVSANARFQNPAAQVSAHYGVSLDGSQLVEWVHPDDVAWHAGDWPTNQRSIGIETETVVGNYDAARPDGLYVRTGALLAALSVEYGIGLEPSPYDEHREIVATYCPGTLDVDRVLREARTILAPAAFPIMGPSAPYAKLAGYIRALAPAAPPEYPVMLSLVAAEFGVRAEVMLAQAIKETGRFLYGGPDAIFSADASYRNFAGIKTTDGKATARFATVELGLVAQAAHLAWYATGEHVGPRCAKLYDPRHFGTSHNGSSADVRTLGGRWAPSLDYGTTIVTRIAEILRFDEGDDVSFNPRDVAADRDFLDARIREVVMAEDIAAFGTWRTLGRAVGPRALGATPPELDPFAGHGAGIDKPPRGPRQAKRPSRAREATR